MSTLYAPVGITPTKPLTPSHLKGVLMLDFMQRFERLSVPGTLWHNRRPWDMSLQTIRFWDYLDRTHDGADFERMSEEQIGALYIACHRSGALPSADRAADYACRIEREGYVHPASQRILSLWAEVFDALGLPRDGLLHSAPFGLGQDEVLERLREGDMLLDQRGFGGGAHLDLSDENRPLRLLISEHGLPNYLLAILRDLLDRAPQHDVVCLYHDDGIARDYEALMRVLQRFGVRCRRIGFARVPVEGLVRSAKHGGWERYTGSRLLERVTGDFAPAEIRLGFRLYFLHALGLQHPADYSDDGLRDALALARQLLAKHMPAPLTDDDRLALGRLIKRDGSANLHGALSVVLQKRASPGLRHAVMECLQ